EHRQRYSEEFKRETVKFAQEQKQKKTMTEIAEDIKVPLSCLHEWMSKYREFENEPVVVEERLKKLERELKEKERELKAKDKKIAETEEELAIVKKAVHIFSRPKK
ncbi:transposase, partial [Gracilibacillus suaedae]